MTEEARAEAPQGPLQRRQPLPSLASNATWRLAAEISGAVFGLLAGVLTARALGPAGKGALSALLYLIAVCGRAATLGLGEAANVLVGRGRATVEASLRALVLPVAVIATLLGAALGAATYFTVLPASNNWLVAAVAVAVVARALVHFISTTLNAGQRHAFTSVVLIVAFTLNALLTFVLVTLLGLGISGAVGAISLSWAAAFVVLISRRSSRPRLAMRIDRPLLRSAARIGVTLEASHLLIALAQRADQLVVLGLAGKAEAGVYSVALTVGQLVIYAPVALSAAAFPRIAQIGASEVGPMLFRTCRIGVAAAAVTAAALIVLAPLGIPLLFGGAFRPAVLPAMILSIAGLIWSAQWLVCRAIAARGRGVLVLRSYSISLIVMLALDLALIPVLASTGAALAAAVSAGAGLTYAFRSLSSELTEPAGVRDMLPRRADFAELHSLVTGSLRSKG